MLWTNDASAEIQVFILPQVTERADGSPFDAATEQKATRIYCNGELVEEQPGPQSVIETDLAPGDYSCTWSLVENNDRESARSGPVNFTVRAQHVLGPPAVRYP